MKFENAIKMVAEYILLEKAEVNCNPQKPLFVSIAGSVSSGKTTFSEMLQKALQASGVSCQTISTDSFLYNNEILEQKEISNQKGFPASYNYELITSIFESIEKGDKTLVPIYDHSVYDIGNQSVTVDNPDIVLVEGINALSLAFQKAASIQFLTDIYIDAYEPVLLDWFLKRFLLLRESAKTDKTSFYNTYAKMPKGKAVAEAKSVWDAVNKKNLFENILPTKENAKIIVTKNPDHSVKELVFTE
jgi:type I pantothenate kinase